MDRTVQQAVVRTCCGSLLLDEGAWNQRTALKEIYVVLNWNQIVVNQCIHSTQYQTAADHSDHGTIPMIQWS